MFIHVLGISEIESLGDIDVLTNGNVTLTEKTGDMRVERIKSTAGDVLLYSPRTILDARGATEDDLGTGRAEADVAGESITLVAGTGLVNPPGTPAEAVNVLSAALAKALVDPVVVKWAAENDVVMKPKTPQEAVAILNEQRAFFEKWKPSLSASCYAHR